ncbi:MAG: aminotransferase class IV [Bacteroidota bacterium]
MVIINGSLQEIGTPDQAILNRAFKYGDSIFESIRIYQGRILFLEDHFDRLLRGMRMLKMRFDETEFLDQLRQAFTELMEAKDIDQHGYLRVQVYRAGLGAYRPMDNQPHYLLEAYSLKQDLFQEQAPIKLATYRELSLQYDKLSPLKTGNSLPYVLARIHAQEMGMDDAVLFCDGYVSETAGANLFIVRQKKIFTPPLRSACLDGVMRKHILQLCKQIKIPLTEKKLKLKDLLQADELFLTNSLRGIMAVNQLEDHLLGGIKQPMTNFLQNCLRQYIEAGRESAFQS